MLETNFSVSDPILTDGSILDSTKSKHYFDWNSTFHGRHTRLFQQHFSYHVNQMFLYYGFDPMYEKHRFYDFEPTEALFRRHVVHGQLTIWEELPVFQNETEFTKKVTFGWGNPYGVVWEMTSSHSIQKGCHFLNDCLPPLLQRSGVDMELKPTSAAEIYCKVEGRDGRHNAILHYGLHQLGLKYTRQGVWVTRGSNPKKILIGCIHYNHNIQITTGLDDTPKTTLLIDPTLAEVLTHIIQNA